MPVILDRGREAFIRKRLIIYPNAVVRTTFILTRWQGTLRQGKRG